MIPGISTQRWWILSARMFCLWIVLLSSRAYGGGPDREIVARSSSGMETGFIGANDSTVIARKETTMTRYAILTMIVPHCKRGPDVCEDCARANIEKVYILDVDPPEKGMVQRPVIDFMFDGSMRSCEYDVVRGFDTEDEAVDYARMNGLDARFIGTMSNE